MVSLPADSPKRTPSSTLLEESRAGGQAALETLMQRHLTRLRAFVRLRCGEKVRNYESVSDVVQSVCREVLLGKDTFEYRGEAAFRHWLCTLAEHRIRDRVRHLQRDKRDVGRERSLEPLDPGAAPDFPYDSLCTPSNAAIAAELREQIEDAFQKLKDSHREVILLMRVIGLSTAETARQLNRSEANTRMLLSRGLAELAMLVPLD